MVATPANAINEAGAIGAVLFDGTATFSTANGTASQVLAGNGTSSAPTFQSSASIGASWVLIQSKTASSSANLAFTTNTNIYSTYVFVFWGIQAGTNTAVFLCQISNNGGSTWITSGYLAGMNAATYNSTTWGNSTSASAFSLTGNMPSGDANKTANGKFSIGNCNVGADAFAYGNVAYYDSGTSTPRMGVIGGQAGSTGANAFNFLMSSGNIAAGTITCYGLRNS